MATLLSCIVSNVVFAGCLAVLGMALTKAWRNPHLAHALWLLVLVKLVTPPIVHIPVASCILTNRLASAQSEHAVAWNAWQLLIPSPDEGSPTTAPRVSSLSTGLNYAADHGRKKSTWETFVASWPQWLLTTWGIGTVAFVGLCVRRHLRVLPLIVNSRAPDAVLAGDAKQLARQIGLRECPMVRVTDAHVCPFVTPGLRYATVVLPRRLLSELNRDQVKSMLAHELAHIRRRDHWIRIFEICILSLNWWNPIAWWGSRQLQQAEEECCDAWVLWVLPEKRRAYGQTLLHTVEYVTEKNVTPALARTSFRSCQLERRIDVIMNRVVNRKMSPAACAFTLVLGTITLPIGLALGQSVASPEAPQDVGGRHVGRHAITPEVAARSYENYLKTVRSIAFHSKFKDRDEKSDIYTNGLSQDWWIDFKEKRLRRITKRLDPKTGLPVKIGSRRKSSTGEYVDVEYYETLLTSDEKHEVSADATSTATGFTSYLRVPDGYWKTDMGLLYLSYPFGYFRDGGQYRYIPDLFQNMSVEDDESSLVVLLCKTKVYELKIQLDRSKCWMANRIEYSRIVLSKDPSRTNYFLYTVDHASNHDGIWIPDSFRCKRSSPEGQQKLPPGYRMVDGHLVVVTGGEDVGVDFVAKEKSTLIAEVALSNISTAALADSNSTTDHRSRRDVSTYAGCQAIGVQMAWRQGVFGELSNCGDWNVERLGIL